MKLEYYNAFKGLLLTGTRFQEFANLRCNDVNLNDRFLYVRNKEGFTTKTEHSVRQIPMSDELHSIITEQLKNKKDNDYLFTGPSGQKLSERTLLAVCKRVASNAGIKSRAFLHKFRHSYASHLLHSDVPIEAIKELLGHANISETLIYAHNKTTHRHHQVQILDDLFNN